MRLTDADRGSETPGPQAARKRSILPASVTTAMLQNPSTPTEACPRKNPQSPEPPYIGPGETTKRRAKTEDEDHAVTQLDLGASLLTQIARRLTDDQLEIRDARRLCISISFIKAALRELEFATIVIPDRDQIVFWD